MKKIFFIAVISIMTVCAQVYTPNTGVVWTMDSLVQYSNGKVIGSNNVYFAYDIIYVDTFDTFIIDDGTTINFDSSKAGLEVNGTLFAEGATLSSTIFDSLKYWAGIKFNDPANDSSYLKNCTIQFGTYGVNAVFASPTIDQCKINGCSYGIRLTQSAALITNNLISHSYQFGINANSSSTPIIKNNTLLENNTKLSGNNPQINIGPQGANVALIEGNHIKGINPKTGGISITTLVNGSSADVTIKNNLIENNAFGITVTGSFPALVIIDSNKIINNNIAPNPLISGSGISVNGTSDVRVYVLNNYIANNLWGLLGMLNTTVNKGAYINAGSIDPIDPNPGNNTFINNGNGGKIYDIYNNLANDIYAQNNVFSSTDPAVIETYIFHNGDDTSTARGKVIYLPVSTASSVEDESTTNPEVFTLLQNYPNPFNPTTTIKFNILKAGNIKLSVVNMLGEEVEVIENRFRNEGLHSVNFDGSNLASGIYLYRLESVGQILVKKMVLMK